MVTDRASLSRTLGLAALPVVFLGYLFVYPLVRILVLSFGEGGGSGFVEVFTDPRLRGSAWFSLWQATLSTALTLLVALPLTWAVARHRFRGRRVVQALATVPFVLPTVVVGGAFVALGLDGSLLAILAAHVFYNLAVVVRTVGGFWSRLDPQLVESARVLGASPWQTFRRITLPLLTPSLAAAASIVFLFTFTSFGVVLILGNLRYRTLEVEIYQQAVSFLDLPTAGALAVLQMAVVGGALAVYSAVQQRRAVGVRLVAETDTLRPVRTPQARVAVATAVIVTLGGLAVPLSMLLVRSLANGGVGWQIIFRSGPVPIEPIQAARNSLIFAVISAVLATVIGLLSALVVARGRGLLSRGFDLLLMLPLGTSAVTIGFGFLIALDRPIDLRATAALIPLSHAVVAIPLVVRVLVPTLRSIRPEIRQAAAILGASPRRVMREIDLPIIARGLAVGGGFAAAVSLGEFGATAFIARPNTATLPFLIFRLLGRPGAVNFSAAMAMAVLLAALTAGLILAADRMRAGELGSF